MSKYIEIPRTYSVIFSQKYYRRYSSNFKSTKRYQNDPKKYDTKIKESAFFFGLDNSIISYMSRAEAADRTDLIENELRENGVSETKILEYMKDRPGSTGLFDVDGSIDDVKVEKIREFLANTPNMGWSCVMSFLPEYSNELVNNPYQAQKLLSTMIPKQLKVQGLNPDEFYWFAAYHTNTDHRHVHYVIVPKDKAIKVKAFSDKDVIKLMPKLVEKTFPMKNNHFPLDRDYFLEEYDKSFDKLSPTLSYKFNDILAKKKQYARLTKEERQIVNSVTWNVLNTNKELKKGLESLKRWAADTEEKIINHKLANGDLITAEDHNFAKTTYYAFMNRVYNKTLKLLNENALANTKSFKEEELAISKLSKKRYKTRASDKKAIRRRSTFRNVRRKKEKMSHFIKRLIIAASNNALYDLNNSYSNLWEELTIEQQNEIESFQKNSSDYCEIDLEN